MLFQCAGMSDFFHMQDLTQPIDYIMAGHALFFIDQ